MYSGPNLSGSGSLMATDAVFSVLKRSVKTKCSDLSLFFFHKVSIRLTENTKYHAKHLSSAFALLSAWSFLWSRIALSLGWPFSKAVSCYSSILSRKSQLTSVQLSETTPLLNEPFIASYLIVWLIKAANQRDSHIQEQGYAVLNSEMLKSFKRKAWQQLCSAPNFFVLEVTWREMFQWDFNPALPLLLTRFTIYMGESHKKHAQITFHPPLYSSLKRLLGRLGIQPNII